MLAMTRSSEGSYDHHRRQRRQENPLLLASCHVIDLGWRDPAHVAHREYMLLNRSVCVLVKRRGLGVSLTTWVSLSVRGPPRPRGEFLRFAGDMGVAGLFEIVH
jgi:hypothetical protein